MFPDISTWGRRSWPAARLVDIDDHCDCAPQRPRDRCGEFLRLNCACSLRTRLPPRPASAPSLRPDSTSRTFLSGGLPYRSAGLSWAAPVTRQSPGFDVCTNLDLGIA